MKGDRPRDGARGGDRGGSRGGSRGGERSRSRSGSGGRWRRPGQCQHADGDQVRGELRRPPRAQAQPLPPSHPRRTDGQRQLTVSSSAAPRRAPRQAVTTTFVPTGAKSHSALASGSHCRMQPCDWGVPSSARVSSRWPFLVGTLWKPIAALGAAGEPHEVLHHAGVVDPGGPARGGVHGVGAGLQVVGQAAGDRVGPRHAAVRGHQPHPLVADVEDDPLAGAAAGRQRAEADPGRGRGRRARRGSVGTPLAAGRRLTGRVTVGSSPGWRSSERPCCSRPPCHPTAACRRRRARPPG